MKQFICGFVINIFTHYFLYWDLNAIYKEVAPLAVPKKYIEYAALKEKMVTLQEIRERIIKKVNDKFEKARNTLKQAEIAIKKNEKAEIITSKRTKKAFFEKLTVYWKTRLEMAKSLT